MNEFNNGSFNEQNKKNQENTDNNASDNVYSMSYSSGNGYNPEFSTSKNKGNRSCQKRNRGAIIAIVITMAVFFMVTFGFFSTLIIRGIDMMRDIITGDEQQGVVNSDMSSDGENPNVTFDNSNSAATIINSGVTVQIETKGSIGESNLTYADVAALVADSVVEIQTEIVSYNSFYGQYISSGAGSGVIISKEGYIITNNHVIDGASSISVRLRNGKTYSAELFATDVQTDIAIIKINPTEELVVATLGYSDTLVVGEEVIAIGNPLGSLGGTVTRGIISALERAVIIDGDDMTLLQTDAAVSPGNSGGGLFNMRGELIGVVNAKYSSDSAEGLAFAIPINTARNVAVELLDHKYVKGRPDHGLNLEIRTKQITQGFIKYNLSYLCIVSSKFSDELKEGDVLKTINGVTPTTVDEAHDAIKKCSIGDSVDVVITRDGEQLTVKLTIGEYEP